MLQPGLREGFLFPFFSLLQITNTCHDSPVSEDTFRYQNCLVSSLPYYQICILTRTAADSMRGCFHMRILHSELGVPILLIYQPMHGVAREFFVCFDYSDFYLFMYSRRAGQSSIRSLEAERVVEITTLMKISLSITVRLASYPSLKVSLVEPDIFH